MTATATTSSLTPVKSAFRVALEEIRSGLTFVDGKVKKWTNLSPNAQGNLVACLRVATNIIGREHVPLITGSLHDTPKNTEYLYEAKKSLLAIQTMDLEQAPVKAQKGYSQEQVERVIAAVRASLGWFETAPIAMAQMPDKGALALTQPKMEGLSLMGSRGWTLPLLNGHPFQRGFGSWQAQVFEEDDENTDQILRLDGQELTVVADGEKIAKVNINPSAERKRFLMDIEFMQSMMPKEMITLINDYWLESHTLWTTSHRPRWNLFGNYFYPLFARTPTMWQLYSEGGDFAHRDPLLGIKQELDSWNASGFAHTISCICLEDILYRTLAHVTITKPVPREVMLVGYFKSTEITCYEAVVTKRPDGKTCVKPLSLEYLPLVVYDENDVLVHTSLADAFYNLEVEMHTREVAQAAADL